MKRLTTSQFIEQATQIHGDLYDYSLVEYVSIKHPVKIVCKEHGQFEQTPNSHITKRAGCPFCSRCVPVTKNSFVQKAHTIHDHNYDYSRIGDIAHMTDKIVVVCPNHGDYNTTVKSHIVAKTGCPKCAVDSRRSTVDDFIKSAKLVHGSMYDYGRVVYISTHTKVEIGCPVHGVFLQTPNNHISSRNGCPLCKEDNKHGRSGGLNIKHLDLPSRLYLIRFSNKSESWLKIGITTRSIKNRWGKTHKGYKVEPILNLPMAASRAYDIEQYVLVECNSVACKVGVAIHGGSTECFIDTPENEQLLTDTIMILLKG